MCDWFVCLLVVVGLFCLLVVDFVDYYACICWVLICWCLGGFVVDCCLLVV